MENIYLRNIEVGQVADAAIRVNFYYGEGDISNYNPVVSNVEVRNMTCDNAPKALYFEGYERSPIQQVRLINCTFNNISTPFDIHNYKNLCLDSVVINGTEYYKIWEPDSAIEPIVTYIDESFVRNEVEPLSLFPNPVHTFASIKLDVQHPMEVCTKIFDLTGRMVFQQVNTLTAEGTQQIILELEGMKTGVYMVRVEGVSFRKQGKLIIK